jgi:cyclic pyranopterin phosphate synthase
MFDLLQRPLSDLRISVTDRCNLRCRYCMPREVYGARFRYLPRDELLTYEEITRLVRQLTPLGVSKVRLTGGEPLLRAGLERLVAMLAETPGIAELALTTNGLLLAPRARDLRRAGLDRVTVSLDALDASVLRAMSDAPVAPRRILAAIDAAAEAGLTPVKVNMVVRRGVNDAGVVQMAEHFRGSGHVLRFIEYMDVGSTNGWRPADVVTGGELRAQLEERWPLEPLAPGRPGEVARRYRYRDGAGEVGFINSVSEPFCGGCTRARLSAEGRLYTCLFARRGHDLRELLRCGGDDRALAERVTAIWRARDDRYSAERSNAATRARRGPGAARPADRQARGARVEMSYIGG